MFAVIFEVTPHKERFDDYLAIAKVLRPQLDAIDGFIDIDRLGGNNWCRQRQFRLFRRHPHRQLRLVEDFLADERARARWGDPLF